MKKEVPEPPASSALVIELRALAGQLMAWLQSRRGSQPVPPVDAWREAGCDVIEDERHFELSLDLPGISPQQIRIAVQEHELQVSAEAENRRSPYSFRHTVPLPGGVDEEKIEARYRNGGLTLILPKVRRNLVRRIEVEP